MGMLLPTYMDLLHHFVSRALGVISRVLAGFRVRKQGQSQDGYCCGSCDVSNCFSWLHVLSWTT
jgi:hypothetical protein